MKVTEWIKNSFYVDKVLFPSRLQRLGLWILLLPGMIMIIVGALSTEILTLVFGFYILYIPNIIWMSKANSFIIQIIKEEKEAK